MENSFNYNWNRTKQSSAEIRFHYNEIINSLFPDYKIIFTDGSKSKKGMRYILTLNSINKWKLNCKNINFTCAMWAEGTFEYIINNNIGKPVIV